MTTWVTPLVGLAVLGGLIFLFFTKGSSETEPSQPSQATEVATSRPMAEVPAVAVQAEGDEVVEDDRPGPGEAVRQLAGELDRARLWSKVTVDGETVIISSGDCATPTMTQVLAANQEALAVAGIATVRCLERHGAVAFERPVSDFGQ